MKTTKRSFFSLRVHWALRVTLVLLLGAIIIFVIIRTSMYLHREDLGNLAPTRSNAHQIASKLILNIGEAWMPPSELFRWRSTGRFDQEPTFSKSALFWFTYNSSLKSFENRIINHSKISSQDELVGWKSRLISVIDSVLTEKNAGQISVHLQDEFGDFHLAGRIYKDEPKVVAMITDMDLFRRVDLPDIFEAAKLNFPTLDVFSTGPEEGPGNSPMFILARNHQDSIIAQIGVPGGYAYLKELGPKGFKTGYPYSDQLGFSLEIVIPLCTEKALLKMITWFFWIFVAIWVATIIRLTRVEILVKKARSNLK